MKSLVSLWGTLARELGALCGIDVSRDIQSVSRRVEAEGDAFLRITLPSLGKAFLRALEEGSWSPTTHTGFGRRGGLPVFLRGFLENIFDTDGALRRTPCTESIRAVLQLTTVFGKIEGSCTPQRNRAAIAEYVAADEECLQWDLDPREDLLGVMRAISLKVFEPMLSRADRRVQYDDITPKHGPGQTADRLVGNRKYDLSYWPMHLESRFPWIEWAVPNPRWGDETYLEQTSPSHVVPARLALVPKTMSRPRIIVMEPTSLQFMQQAVLATIVDSIEATTSLIGFTDQEPNRQMARKGSADGSLVTLDLSEASDRVTYSQAAAVFGVHPHLWEALAATRSREVELPDGSQRPIHKFASMGSAVCFPVEAVVFLAGILTAMVDHHRRAGSGFELTPSLLRELEGKVRVYGDDCIFPADYLPAVERTFQSLGWRVNRSKTFRSGKFRESCGGEYWDGEDVTPVKARSLLPTTRKQVPEVQSLVSFRNQMYFAGYWNTARYLDGLLTSRGLLGDLYPIVEDTSPALGRHSASFQPLWLGTDRYQRSLTRAWTVRQVIPRNPCSEVGALLKCLIATGYGDEHLERSGRPVDVSINRQWMPTA